MLYSIVWASGGPTHSFQNLWEGQGPWPALPPPIGVSRKSVSDAVEGISSQNHNDNHNVFGNDPLLVKIIHGGFSQFHVNDLVS